MEQSLARSAGTDTGSTQRDSNYGVQSLEDTLEDAFGGDSKAEAAESSCAPEHIAEPEPKATSERPRSHSNSSEKASSKHSEPSLSPPRRRHRRKMSKDTTSNPLTPFNIGARSPMPDSALASTPRSVSVTSLKLSDEESVLGESVSQAVASDAEEDDGTQQGQSSFPQLVMPSIQMPERRPFTAKGKAMGKLKVLIAGEAGSC
jgi:hypothetical protein